MITRALNNRRPPAFTLIEVLLAVMVFSIVLTAIHTVFYSAIHLRNKAVESVDKALPLNRAIDIMRRDLAGIVRPGGTLFGDFITSAAQANGTNQLRPGFYTATAHLGDLGTGSDVQKVNYYLAVPTNQTTGKDLCRAVTRNLLPVMQEDIKEQRLLSGVDNLVLLYYDGLQWQESWDSTLDPTPLPYAVKVQIYLVPNPAQQPNFARIPIEFIVPLLVTTNSSQSTNTTDSSGGGA
jgi:type II secretion system protein J